MGQGRGAVEGVGVNAERPSNGEMTPGNEAESTRRIAFEEAEQLIAAGQQLEDSGNVDEALSNYRMAIAQAPNHARAWLNVGNALRKLHRAAEAESAFRHALALNPDYAPALFNLGTLLAEADNREAAKAALHKALKIQPEMLPKVLEAESYLLFRLALRDVLGSVEIAREHVRVGAAIAKAAGRPFNYWTNTPDAARRIRIGYVSGDFAVHPVALFLRPILERHDYEDFDIYCYSNTPQATTIAENMRQRVTVWREIAGMGDDEVAALMRQDGIDVLVDLSGHSEYNRLGVFAKHPAPVQVTWLGYLNTTGLVAMDYRICDRHTDPEGETEALHTEILHRMRGSQWCYVPWGPFHEVPTPHADRPDAIIFGSFNQYQKISDDCLDLWTPIFARIPEARLVVFDVRDCYARDSLLSRLAQRGIDSDRVTLHDRTPVADYFRAMGNVDVALDTYPYNGATTTFDALWMGVPLVALRGHRGISRSSFSILQSLELPELVATSPGEYVDINVHLAQDRGWRGVLRASLRTRLAASPLMDLGQFVEDLESAYRLMWTAWCERKG